MEKSSNGSWSVNLNGICYRELYELGKMLTELGERGNIYGTELDLETLEAGFDSRTGEVFLFDGDGNSSLEEEQ